MQSRIKRNVRWGLGRRAHAGRAGRKVAHMASLTLEHVGKKYPNGYEGVKDFNLEIADKEFIIFVGPSGCGKSTTLRMIAGLEDITSGTLKIDGRVVNDVEPKDRDIAMVFQTYALYPHMTVYENMAFPLKLRKVDASNRLFTERLGFDSSLCTTILLDDSEDLTEVSSILESFGIDQSSQEDRKRIREIVDCVITRSARLMGACLFTVLQHMAEYGMAGSIGVDGSVYKYVPGYKARMVKAMRELGMENVECGIAEDGTPVGAALIGYYSSTLCM